MWEAVRTVLYTLFSVAKNEMQIPGFNQRSEKDISEIGEVSSPLCLCCHCLLSNRLFQVAEISKLREAGGPPGPSILTF